MNEQTITVTLPDTVCDRIRVTARATSLSFEEVIQQSVALLLPAFESDIPTDIRLSLAKLSLLNDIQLWKIANSVMDNARQLRFESLAEKQKHQDLSEEELSELEASMEEARQLMLYKAEAKRLLSQRGHRIFRSDAH